MIKRPASVVLYQQHVQPLWILILYFSPFRVQQLLRFCWYIPSLIQAKGSCPKRYYPTHSCSSRCGSRIPTIDRAGSTIFYIRSCHYLYRSVASLHRYFWSFTRRRTSAANFLGAISFRQWFGGRVCFVKRGSFFSSGGWTSVGINYCVQLWICGRRTSFQKFRWLASRLRGINHIAPSNVVTLIFVYAAILGRYTRFFIHKSCICIAFQYVYWLCILVSRPCTRGIVGVGQLQLLQPFFGLLLSALILHESVRWLIFFVNIGVVLCVPFAKKFVSR